MDLLTIATPLKLFGNRVTTFPNGLTEAFNGLASNFAEGLDRDYYGISRCPDGEIEYYAMTPIEGEEASQLKGDTFVIEPGVYLAESLSDWRSKTRQINGIFSRLLDDARVDKESPAVEWYKNDKEMVCMIKTIEK
jgi:hypothetical protein